MRPPFPCDGPPAAAWADGPIRRLLKRDGPRACDAYLLPAGRECATLAAMLVAVAAKVTVLQRPRRSSLSELDDCKSQGVDCCGAA